MENFTMFFKKNVKKIQKIHKKRSFFRKKNAETLANS